MRIGGEGEGCLEGVLLALGAAQVLRQPRPVRLVWGVRFGGLDLVQGLGFGV